MYGKYDALENGDSIRRNSVDFRRFSDCDCRR